MKKLIAILCAVMLLSSLFCTAAFAEETVDYGNASFSRIRQATLDATVEKGKNIPAAAFWDQSEDKQNGNTRLTNSTVGISDHPMFRVTRSTGAKTDDNSVIRVASLYTDRESSINAEALMYYLEIPEEITTPTVQFSWNMYDSSGEYKNGHIYNGSCAYLEEGSKRWVKSKIEGYWFSLPAGFSGYVRFETADIDNAYADDWQLITTHIYMPNLNNNTILMSAPFIVEDLGDIGHAAYINDETAAVRDLFSGETLSREQATVTLSVGETLDEMPEATTDLALKLVDEAELSKLKAEFEWDAYEGAAGYSLRLFKKTNSADGIVYEYVSEVKADSAKAAVEDLEDNARYAVSVSALSEDGTELAVYEYVNIHAVAGSAAQGGLSPTLIIVIAVAAVAVIAVVVVIILVSKKKKA